MITTDRETVCAYECDSSHLALFVFKLRRERESSVQRVNVAFTPRPSSSIQIGAHYFSLTVTHSERNYSCHKKVSSPTLLTGNDFFLLLHRTERENAQRHVKRWRNMNRFY